MTVLPSILTPKNRRLPFLLITLLTLAILIISVISLVSGELIIFQNLFYFPIILACVYYVKRGFVFSVILACSYFFLMLIFSQDPVVLQGTAIRVLIFILVAGVITYLSIVRMRTEDALRETEEEIHLLLDSTAEAIYGIDMNNNCTFCNSACLRLLGYKRPDELFGKNMHWQIHSKRLDGSPFPVEECRMIQEFHNGKGVHVDDEVFWRSDDTPFPTEYWSYPILRDGVVAGAVVTFFDITDRKKTEEETQRERAFFDQLVESAPEGIAITDTQGAVMRVNTEFVRMFGYGVDEAVGQSIDDLVVPPARQEEARELTKSAGQRGEILLDTVRRRKDGTLVDVSVIAAPIMIAGKQEAVYVIYRDITKRKRAEEETQRERAFFDRLVESAPEGIAITDTQGRVMRVNTEFVRMFGYGVDEAIGQSIDDLVAPPGREEEARAITTSSVQGEKTLLETVRRRKDGTLVDVSLITAPILIAGKQEAVYAIYRDITKRKRAEEETQRERAFFDQLVETAPEGIAITDTQGAVMRVNTEFVRMFGYGVDEAVGQSIDDLVVPPARQEEARELTKSAGQRGEILLDTVRRRKDGTLVDVSLITAPILIAGKQEAVYVIYRDITKRKRAEEALWKEQMSMSALMENIPDHIYFKDTASRFLRVNSAMARRFGLRASVDVVGKTDADFFSEEYANLAIATEQEIMRTGQPLTKTEEKETWPDGSVSWVVTTKLPQRDLDGRIIGICGISSDITERKQMEQKLEEMATHDFLTGLPNRVLLLDRFTIAAALAHRNKARIAVMSLDLDNFKSINDTFGHDAGDQVLKVISTRLVRILRASDTFARVGGDEFISVMMETDHIKGATAIAQKILDSFTEPLSIAGHQLHLSTSIGIAIYPEDAEDLETLTKKSDAAMYYSKSHGRNQFKFYDDGDVQIG